MNELSLPQDNEELRLLADSAEAFAKKSLAPARLRALRKTEIGFDRALWQQLGDLGWTALLVPEPYGGLGLTLLHMTTIIEALGKRLLPEPLAAISVLTTSILAQAENETLKQQLLPRLAAADLIAAVAWQEGTRLDGPREARATQRGSTVAISGRKRYVRPGAGCDGVIVATDTGENTALYWVPRDTEGVRFGEEKSADGSPSGIVELSDARVPLEFRLAAGFEAASLLRRALDAATIATSAELLGLMRGAFDATLEHLGTRTQFGKKIGSFQALQHRIVDLYIQIRLSAACVADVVSRYESTDDPSALSALASRAKSRCSDAALLVTREAVQMHGAIGFTDEHDIGLYLNRAFVLASWLGNGTEHRARYTRLQGAAAGSEEHA